MISSEESWKIKDFAFQLSSVPSLIITISLAKLKKLFPYPVHEKFPFIACGNIFTVESHEFEIVWLLYLNADNKKISSLRPENSEVASNGIRSLHCGTFDCARRETFSFFPSCKISRWLRLLTRSFASFVIPLNKKEKYSKSFNILI